MSFLTALTLVGCALSTETEPVPISVQFGAKMITLLVPPGRSDQFPNRVVTESISKMAPGLYDDDIANPRILSALWDFGRQGWSNSSGSVTIKLSIACHCDSPDGEAITFSNLESIVRQRDIRDFERMKEVSTSALLRLPEPRILESKTFGA